MYTINPAIHLVVILTSAFIVFSTLFVSNISMSKSFYPDIEYVVLHARSMHFLLTAVRVHNFFKNSTEMNSCFKILC